MVLWYLRWKCWRNRQAVAVLKWVCKEYRCETKTAYYPHTADWEGCDLPMTITHTYLVHRFRFGDQFGWSLTLGVSAMLVTRQGLTRTMSEMIDQVEYVGLKQSELKRLLAVDHPQLTTAR
jgi:hypothetical protein